MTGYSLHLGLNVVDSTTYIPAPATLSGCVFDATDMQKLAAGQGFMTKTLLDVQATSNALLSSLSQLSGLAVAGDLVLITYSGHGGQVSDSLGEEEDGLDETWCLFDRQVLDDELNRMYAQFAAGVRLLVLSDSCHSGTVAKSVLAIATREALRLNPLGRQYWPPDVEATRLRPRALPVSVAMADSARRRELYQSVQALAGRTRSVDLAASLILISGCQDNQLSSDGDRNGLFTETLLKVWADGNFAGDYHAFHGAIVRCMPPDQTPNLYLLGDTSSFQCQKPFTVEAPPAGVVAPTGGGTGGGVPTTSRPTLRQGDSGPDVRDLQQALADQGAWLSVDGRFGPGTAAAVRDFQRRNGLTADGIVGPATWAALLGGPVDDGGASDGGSSDGGGSGGWGDGGTSGGTGGSDGGWGGSDGGWGGGSSDGGSSGGGSTGGTGGSTGGGGAAPVARPTLRRGSRGPDVVYLQQRLCDFGYTLVADGGFGPATESAVRSFQRSWSLVADGVVGPATWQALG